MSDRSEWLSRRMNYRGYDILIEPRGDGPGYHGRVALTRDDVTFSAEDMGRFRREAESAIDFYLKSCEASGREPESPGAVGFLTVLDPDRAARLREMARSKRLSAAQMIARLIASAVDESAEDTA